MPKKAISLTPRQYAKLWKKLEKEYPSLLKRIGFSARSTYETICGAISGEIHRFLREDLGIDARFVDGEYKGRGTEFSGGEEGTGHCWVELLVQIKSKTRTWGFPKKPFKVIIDGAYAQFFPNEMTPKFIRDRMRLTIFMNDKVAEKWYKGRENHNYSARLNKKVNL